MQTVWQDLHYGARMLMKEPGFTLASVIAPALGIGANIGVAGELLRKVALSSTLAIFDL